MSLLWVSLLWVSETGSVSESLSGGLSKPDADWACEVNSGSFVSGRGCGCCVVPPRPRDTGRRGGKETAGRSHL